MTRFTFLLVLASAAAAQTTPTAPIKVLFIGNSYTYVNDLPATLSGFGGIETAKVTVGGSTLKAHWGRPAALEAIRKGEWDYVVLQEHSLFGGYILGGEPSPFPNAPFLEFSRLFNAEIRKTKAKTVLYLPGAREGFPETQARLTDAYWTLAREISALPAPVGLAFASARILQPGIKLYNKDQSHPNPAGTYLAACVFYAVLTGQSPIGLPGTLEDAAFLQQVAWRTYLADPILNPITSMPPAPSAAPLPK